ncbi:hypothetical protein VDGE_09810 [Verticillium dahliae]|uniref:Cupin type-2 domain-containing protein n=1 Tax=Verticillium dahliae TaxID=27337 RepID=A0A444RP30_VERDA|nr:hypothetical protein VDGE_09810 [Verticillium dahliae]
MALVGKLAIPKRFITANNDKGEAIIDQSIPAEADFVETAKGDASFFQPYVTNTFPVDLGNRADVTAYEGYRKKPPGLSVSTGTVLRYVDMPPGALSPMHKTVSLDYGVVIEGNVELVLDSGETQLLERGDICVQRATMHAWRNVSQTEWARMLYVLQPATSSVPGEELSEDYGGMPGVASSD